MDTHLPSAPEKAAENAENLPAFSGFKLLHVRRQLTELLNLVTLEAQPRVFVHDTR